MSYYSNYITDNFNIEGNMFTYTINNSAGSINYNNNDYIHKIFVKLKLPDIYSSSDRQFKWIKYLGYNIIKDVKCTIKFKNTSTVIEKNLYTYTEWLYIWNEINLSEEEKKIHYMLIGHTPELYDPALHNNNVYPVSHLNRKTYDWIINDTNTAQANYVVIDNDYNYNKPPSIPATTLYIPLNFYFCNDINNILPLYYIAKIKINITLRPVDELYTVLLVPEDFVLEKTSEQISTTNYNTNIKLPNNINFVNNKIPYFSSNAHLESNSNINNLSMFDVLLNKYRIKPLTFGNTSINNFILDTSSVPENNNIINLQTTVNTLGLFYNDICNINILFNIINTKKTINKIKLTGLFYPVTFTNILDTKTYTDGSVKESKFNITHNIINPINDIFFIIRHAERENKNDLLNFTNLDYNNTLEWDLNAKKNNTVSYSSNIELLSNSIWEHQSTNSSIKIGVDNIGVFYIKKHILEDNIFKYIDIINYKSDNNYSIVNNNIYNSNSSNIINEKILDKFKITIEDKNYKKFAFTSQSESYNFYNKITLYKKYNNTIKGLYYINNKYNGLTKLEISSCDYNKITINDSDEYKLLLFCNETININIQ